MTDAERDVLAERRRQVEQEGFSAAADDGYKENELVQAAISYLIANDASAEQGTHILFYWPWSLDWWKPTDRRRDLIKAAALILAELERMDRLK